jgi:hypothetical protein
LEKPTHLTNVPRPAQAGSLRLRSPRQLADNLLFSLFALHRGIFALLVPWHVGEGASAYLGNVIRVVCFDDESILHYDPIALCLVESEGNNNNNTDDITQVSRSTFTINVPRHKQGKYTTMQGKQAEQEVVG